MSVVVCNLIIWDDSVFTTTASGLLLSANHTVILENVTRSDYPSLDFVSSFNIYWHSLQNNSILVIFCLKFRKQI